MDIIIANEQDKVIIDESLYEKLEQVGILALTEAGSVENYEVSVLLTDIEMWIQKLMY